MLEEDEVLRLQLKAQLAIVDAGFFAAQIQCGAEPTSVTTSDDVFPAVWSRMKGKLVRGGW